MLMMPQHVDAVLTSKHGGIILSTLRITLCQIVIYCTYVGMEEVNIWYMDPLHVVVDVKVTADLQNLMFGKHHGSSPCPLPVNETAAATVPISYILHCHCILHTLSLCIALFAHPWNPPL